ncbi:helix-turn-helix transcriptional regulator [Bacillus thuringiensis]|jgi:transcriptional regulator with XRE-family HTH domain|uniref:Helix-turn-helix transcriptional regulator n=3 Tax=Bacillus thuringiensis TaxID=1428 RepID=A0A0B5NQ85_BACTU|nr:MULTISPECIES: helix-turn-helix transcriptional regulator [Bacillus]MEC2535159.1 helix-turn-helix transcriptional regulator [Bacillus cereus]MED1153726.1 helix-turn-helix transcriptional regulator [Bacillus paranthracis]OUB09402.1 hypothetical protein BK708_33315 [Bacillus thuringiensis serovar yunnanensis]AFQ30045.1 DNA-binding protein [Bacillus thuringiensis HD-789]AJG74233.1 hypothetical protein BF38_5840 [Bacillus thuringiensis]
MLGLEYVLFIKGLSGTEIAKNIGVSSQMVNHWVQARRPMDSERLAYFEGLLEVPSTYLNKEIDSKDRLEIDIIICKTEGVSIESDVVNKTIELETMRENYAKLLNKYNESLVDKKEFKEKIIAMIQNM